MKNYEEGTKRFGAREFRRYVPDAEASRSYDTLYGVYRSMASAPQLREAMHALNGFEP